MATIGSRFYRRHHHRRQIPLLWQGRPSLLLVELLQGSFWVGGPLPQTPPLLGQQKFSLTVFIQNASRLTLECMILK